MRHILRLLLIFGAVVGLFGQGFAYAAGPSSPIATMASIPMAASCMDMMQGSQPEKSPCNGLTLDCIAAMGCVVPLVLVDHKSPLLQLAVAPLATFWPSHQILLGQDWLPNLIHLP